MNFVNCEFPVSGHLLQIFEEKRLMCFFGQNRPQILSKTSMQKQLSARVGLTNLKKTSSPYASSEW
jgi:hypothetical protein